jgi:cytidylate kinase
LTNQTVAMKAARQRSPSLLIITGSMGSGKTTVMAEASDILALRRIPHAAIDLDTLGLAHLASGAANDTVMYRNLQAVAHNYAVLGVDRFLVARAIESQFALQSCIAAVAAREVIVCRLAAPVETMQQRVQSRELGMSRNKYIERVAILNTALDRAGLENFVIINEGRPLHDIANEVLERAGW